MGTVQVDQDGSQVELSLMLDLTELAAKVAAHIQPSDPEPEGFIGTSEALDFLGWGEGGYSRLLRRCRADSIPHYRESRQLYFLRSELREWMRGEGK